MGAKLRMVEGQNVEITLDPKNLQYQNRKDLGREYFQWIIRVESLKAKLNALLVADALVFVAAFLFGGVFLLALLPLIPLTFKAQFDWGDKLDDKTVWESKYVTRVDCLEDTGPELL